MRKRDLIYPIPLKAASPIRTWKGWPDDVIDRLREWNRRHRGLSFNGYDVFKCVDCDQFCEPQPNGTATIYDDPICDDCLVERARRANRKAETIELGRPEGTGSCICTFKRDEGWTFHDDCTYHRAAREHPANHSFPWNCPTYWDGCNCTLPQHNEPER